MTKELLKDPEAITEALQGSWRAVYSEVNGRMTPVDEFAGITHRFDGNSFVVEGGVGVFRGRFSVEGDTSPTEVVYLYEGDAGPFAGAPRQGLLQIEADTLKLCMGPSGHRAPKEFNTTPGSQLVLTVFERLADNGEIIVNPARLNSRVISQW